jgi:hypothetical protein
MARRAVADNDLGFNEIEEQIRLLDKSYVLVGFQEGETTKTQIKGDREKEGGLSLPQIAAANEFGTKSIQARPFMSTSFDENRTKINQFVQAQYGLVLDGKSNAAVALGRVGLAMVGLIQRKIREIRYPPNSPRTIAIKRSSKPLIDFGQMVQSVREKVVINR